MNMTLIVAIAASLCIGGAAGAGATHYLIEKPACAGNDAAWKKFINVPPQTDPGTTYK